MVKRGEKVNGPDKAAVRHWDLASDSWRWWIDHFPWNDWSVG